MNKVKAVIEMGDDGNYAIYLPDVVGLYGSGITEEEAKASLNEAIEMAREYAGETGEWNDYEPLKGNITIDYTYDMSGFFKTYDIFDVSALGRKIGISASLMRHYKAGKPMSQTQKLRIETGIHKIAENLLAVKF